VYNWVESGSVSGQNGAAMILVTGATGHIGNVLVRQLLEKGHAVRAFVLTGSDETALQGLDVDIAYGDVRDLASVRQAMHGVEAVFHLAAIITILPGSQPDVYRVNLDGTRHVLQAAQEAGVRRLVYTSSIHAIQRIPHGRVIDESLPFDPNTSYGEYDRSKAQATLAVIEAAHKGLDAVVVCPTGVIGPFDYGISSMTASLLNTVRDGAATVIRNSAYDFADVRDVAAGLIAAWERGRTGESYILSGGYLSGEELHLTVGEATGRPTKINYLPTGVARVVAFVMGVYCRITGTVPVLTPYALEVLLSNPRVSHAKATRELGYNPRPPRQAILELVAWYRANRALFPALKIP
jgi:dihydroflavonol-4-reductase